MSDYNLRDCPFCGSPLEIDIDTEYFSVAIRHTKLTDCIMPDIELLDMPIGLTIDDIVTLANKRPQEDAIQKQLDELKTQLKVRYVVLYTNGENKHTFSDQVLYHTREKAQFDADRNNKQFGKSGYKHLVACVLYPADFGDSDEESNNE